MPHGKRPIQKKKYDKHGKFQMKWFTPFSPNLTNGDAYNIFVSFNQAKHEKDHAGNYPDESAYLEANEPIDEDLL